MRGLATWLIGVFFLFASFGSAAMMGDYKEKSVEEILSLAEAGNVNAQYTLGRMYIEGYRVPKDYAKALEWVEKAAAQNDSNALFLLGGIYYDSIGVPQDYIKARRLFEASADQDNLLAQLFLGFIYEKGFGVKKDYVKAREWYEKSVAQGYPSAFYHLGGLYERGRGVKQDYAKAHEWMEKAAAQNEPGSQYALGFYYHHGMGVTQDYAQAREWYEKAAKLGEKNAIEALDDLIFIALSEGAVNVKASQLYKNYSENEVRASLTYDGSPLVLEGKIDSIGFSPIFSRPVLRFSIPSNSYASVQAVFKKEDAEYLAEMNKGEIVKVICRGGASFSLVSVLVSDCVVP